jgi:DNA-binding transcriptional regulator LsrR (DeoR family)
MPDARNSAKDLGASDAAIAHVAMLYYREGLNQGDIAQRVGVSRATIVNWLKHAREKGIVEIRVRGESFIASSLAKQVTKRFGLADTYISRDDIDPLSREELRNRTAILAAQAMLDLLTDDDSLGVDWGETVLDVAKSFPRCQMPRILVQQLVGSVYSKHFFASETCAIEIARHIGARCRTLHAPVMLSSPELAERLRNEPVIAAQLREIASLSKALFSVGGVSNETTIISAGVATADDVAWYRDRGAAAVLACRFIDQDGNAMDGPLSDRIIGASPETLRAIPTRMLVASGIEKAEAIRALLKGGYVSHLIVDELTAQKLIDP